MRYNLGIDIGSTTIKMVVLDPISGDVVFDVYKRHQAQVQECLSEYFQMLKARFASAEYSVCMTGSVGMGMAERLSLPFVQEVVATVNYLTKYQKDVSTVIDIGGEDAKMIFVRNGRTTDLRMNGNCAGGTGAFIDQMAVLLNVTPAELSNMAGHSKQTYPIASRCGVFCKTDIQNLMARNIPGEDIAASIFHAVAVQTMVTLAHGHDIAAPVLLCGGPLTFLPALRKAFAEYLRLPEDSFRLPDKANMITAVGTALSEGSDYMTADELLKSLESSALRKSGTDSHRLSPIFKDKAEYENWRKRMSGFYTGKASFSKGVMRVYLGIDSGSTTTKLVLLTPKGELLFSRYLNNDGNPVKAAEKALLELSRECAVNGTELQIEGSCSTGYGEDLVKAAFRLDNGIVETMAHYLAAKELCRDVSFVLDIGGQDMKAIFIKNDSIRNIEVNEACSSGCGSFISTFASSLGCSIKEFTEMACLAQSPCDLGTRCTVFMNSKVKQVLREGTSTADIAAGLSYSVIKNCLYKVLRLNDQSELGEKIVVQGGTMRNDSIVRALELLTGKNVRRSDCPELMGAMGCALYAMSRGRRESVIGLREMLDNVEYTSTQRHCRGCENQCIVTAYKFKDNNTYYSGNRCEKVFTNKGKTAVRGSNAYEMKRRLLFDREAVLSAPSLVIGIPRCLNMFEEYPFWHALFTACNIQVRLSDVSVYADYERCASKVMSDNICFPAKLVHSHIDNLLRQKVERIFMPLVMYEKFDKQSQNSYNCPIVSGYSQVVKSVRSDDTPIDSPVISFKDKSALYKQCRRYLQSLGVKDGLIRKAFDEALKTQEKFERDITEYNDKLLKEAEEKGALTILLAGRPYHTDALIQHKVSEMIAAQGAYVLTDDIVRDKPLSFKGMDYLPQWAFTNRIIKSARWAAGQGRRLQYMQLTSFGCGPDAFLTDEVRAVLKRGGKNLTLLKIDDVNNIGSLKLRVRSLIESLGISENIPENKQRDTATLPPYTSEQRGKKIIAPFFTPFISPLIPSIVKLAGYDLECLPMSDRESDDWGLRNSNNEVCYPATLIVGDIVKAFKSKRYDPDNTCVAITQTGGQCRASNYISLIRKALVENGYVNTPVISLAVGSGIDNDQPAFKINWFKILPVALASIIYSDSIAKLYYASVVRETEAGAAGKLRDKYLSAACGEIESNNVKGLYSLLASAAKEFDGLCLREERPKVGVIGEIFLKFHPFAQKHVVDWLLGRKIEVVYPALVDFFIQTFVNQKVNRKENLKRSAVPERVLDFAYSLVRRELDKANDICKGFRYFIPFEDIFDKAKLAGEAISLNIQFGEGWLLAGEIASLSRSGVNHIVSLQPFGCIANHIAEKGIENRLKALYPDINILSLDFDGSVSEVNIINRMLLFINDIQ